MNPSPLRPASYVESAKRAATDMTSRLRIRDTIGSVQQQSRPVAGAAGAASLSASPLDAAWSDVDHSVGVGEGAHPGRASGCIRRDPWSVLSAEAGEHAGTGTLERDLAQAPPLAIGHHGDVGNSIGSSQLHEAAVVFVRQRANDVSVYSTSRCRWRRKRAGGGRRWGGRHRGGRLDGAALTGRYDRGPGSRFNRGRSGRSRGRRQRRRSHVGRSH
eukprot:6380934-Prymnesium_polylepis.1